MTKVKESPPEISDQALYELGREAVLTVYQGTVTQMYGLLLKNLMETNTEEAYLALHEKFRVGVEKAKRSLNDSLAILKGGE